MSMEQKWTKYLSSAFQGIPWAGGVIATIFEEIITPELEKRKKEWLDNLAHAFNQLEKKGEISLSDIKEKDAFTDIFIVASNYAIKTHLQEKRKALKNLVVNSVLRQDPDFSLILIYLNKINDFTDWHLLILYFYRSPREWFDKYELSVNSPNSPKLLDTLLIAFPELKEKEDFIQLVWDDLKSDGFITHNNNPSKRSYGFAKMTTKLGDDFIEYIQDPEGV